MMEEIELPNSWVSCTIKEIGELFSGGTPSTKDSSYWGDEIPWISPVDLSDYSDKSISRGRKSITEKGLRNSSAKLMPAGTVLFSSRAPIGYTVIASNQLCTNQGFKSIKPLAGNSSDFVFYYLKASKNLAEKHASGTTFKELSLKAFADLPFPLPPLAEQQRIVAKIEELFSSLDKGIETLKTAKAQLKVYRQAVLKYAFEGKLTSDWRRKQKHTESKNNLQNQIFDAREKFYKELLDEWEISLTKWENSNKENKKPSKPSKLVIPDAPSLDHLNRKWDVPNQWLWTQIGTICFVTKLAGFEYTEFVKYDPTGDLPVLKAENAGANGFKVTEYSKVHSSSVQMLKRSILNGGELLIAFVGSVGNVATVPSDQKYFLGPNIGMARPYLKINTKFLEYQLQSALGRNLLLASMKAVTQPSLSMGTIRQTPVVLTSYEEQEQIVQEIESRLSVCDKIEESIEQSLQQAEALRQSILKKAFEGKLVKQNPKDEPASVLLQRIKAERALLQTQGKNKPQKVVKEKKTRTKKEKV